MSYEIRIRKRDSNIGITQETYEVGEETANAIKNLCLYGAGKLNPVEAPTDATPIEFGCHDGVCEIE